MISIKLHPATLLPHPSAIVRFPNPAKVFNIFLNSLRWFPAENILIFVPTSLVFGILILENLSGQKITIKKLTQATSQVKKQKHDNKSATEQSPDTSADTSSDTSAETIAVIESDCESETSEVLKQEASTTKRAAFSAEQVDLLQKFFFRAQYPKRMVKTF